jgi:hypothetical protein
MGDIDGTTPQSSMESTQMSNEQEVVRLIAGHKRSGETVYENALGIRLSDSDVKLVHTPGLALGIAAGDVIRVNLEGEYQVISHGGNIAVYVYADPPVALSITAEIEALGGYWDGGVKNLTIFTIPVSAEFDQIEPILNALVAKNTSVEWYYGNVYDLTDGVTPLNWWVRPGPAAADQV